MPFLESLRRSPGDRFVNGLLAVSAVCVFGYHLAAPASEAKVAVPEPSDALLDIARQAGCVERGRKVFFDRNRGRCSGCHSIDETTGLAGPNLWMVGTKFDKKGLLYAILEPSAEIAPEYHVYILDTESQGLVVGVISDETAEGVTVTDELGEAIHVNPQEIVSRRQSDLSMMPDDIAQTISKRELIDLLEFLATLRPSAADQL